MIKKVALAVALSITVIMVLSLTQFSPRNSGPIIPANTPPSNGKLSDFWAGNAYFERSQYLPLASDGSTRPSGFEEAAPIARPDKGPNVIYLYYRTSVLNSATIDGAIALAVSNDGGASYRVVKDPVLSPGSSPYSICDWDSEHVIAPSVVKVGSTFYMVYEGANLQSLTATLTNCDPLVHVLTNGDIGLATSSDGVTWTKRAGTFPGLFLQHNIIPPTILPSAFECNNIGTPSIADFNSQFFIFYHGDCGTALDFKGLTDPYDLRNKIGMAYGPDTDINSVVKNSNPIMDIGNGQYSWDSRVNSRASVIQGDDGYYYMSFEGSYYVFCHQFGTQGANIGRWGWGLARTADLVKGPWEKYVHNPIRQVYANETGCGMDIPYIFQFNGIISVFQRPETRLGFTHYDRNVLLTGQDPYLHLYPSTVQCKNYHRLGQLESDGWSASTGFFTLPDYMCYGPYETSLPAGKYAVNFRDLIDTTSGVPTNIVFVNNINDAYGGCGSCNQDARTVLRSDFVGGGIYQQINEQFSVVSGHPYEWRTYFDNTAYTKQNEVAVRQLDGSLDTVAPTASVSSLPANSPSVFTVSWGGSDTEAGGTGIWSYDIQYQVNNGPWTNLNFSTGAACCIGTTATSFSFQGQCFNTYNFQALARDNSGNVGSYPNSAQATTYVACDFGVSGLPNPLNINAGSTGTWTITVNSLLGFTGTVALTDTTPTGLTCSAISPSTISLTSTSTSGTSNLSCSGGAVGTYNVNVNGTSGKLLHTTTLTANIGDFSISASPQIQTVNTGATATFAVTLNPINGFSGTANLSVSPRAASCSISPISVSIPSAGTSTGTSNLLCSASTAGRYSISVTGSSGSLTHSTSVQLVVGLAYNFQDNFTYASISQMSNTGWNFNTPSQASVSGGLLTLVNDGVAGSQTAWGNVTPGVGNWTVAVRAEWVGGLYGTLQLNAFTARHSYVWHADGYPQLDQYIFYRDGQIVLRINGYTPTLNVWHTLRIDMLNGKISLYFDSGLITTYTETDPGTALTQFGPAAGWNSADSYTFLRANMIKFTLTLQGYDYNQAQEETLTLNGQLLAQLPTTYTKANTKTYATFSLDMTSLFVRGTNTLTFTHANTDCKVVDSTTNVQITDANGAIILSDLTVRPLSCTQSITYTFTI